MSKRTIRRSKQAGLVSDGQGQIKDIVSIRQRPATVEDRGAAWPLGGRSLIRVEEQLYGDLGRTSYPLRNVGEGGQQRQLIRQARKLPSEQYKSLTWDRGKELTDHRRFTLTTNIDVYFYDPQSPWQRGSDENTNGLLRQYFPKGTDLSVLASPLEQSGTSAQRTAT